MALTQQQIQRLQNMPPEARRAFHTNRIATSLEAIEQLLRDVLKKLDPKSPNGPAETEVDAANDQLSE